MPDAWKLAPAIILAVALVGCDSTSPPDDLLLHVRGNVLVEGQVPAPPVAVAIQAWPDLEADGSSTAILPTDAAGQYAADLGPFPGAAVDSLHVRVTHYDCGMQLTTILRRIDVALGGGHVMLPTIDVAHRLAQAQFGLGMKACAAIVTPATIMTPSTADHARLALWIDEISDSVRGRWRLNHSLSIGDDFGYFSGALEGGLLLLQLHPTPPTPCTGITLEIPVGGGNGSTLGAGELVGDGSCSVPNVALRFYEGAELGEVLPPNGRLELDGRWKPNR